MKERKTDKLLKEYKNSLTTTTRTRYPKIDLHPTFVSVLDKQINVLRKRGISDKVIKDRLQRAIPFHIYDEPKEEN
jgi:hypothetical protein